jgi:CheY-like chemotaxis protein
MEHRILIVDDDPASRYIYRQVLSSFELVEAADGAEAIELLRDQRFDLVLLDMLLPRVQGTEVLSFIYDDPELAKMRVLVITAHDDYRHLRLRTGDMLLLKPITPKQLRETANRSLVTTSA